MVQSMVGIYLAKYLLKNQLNYGKETYSNFTNCN